jgi:hypothetical protein
LKHFRVWTRAKVLQDGVYKVGGEFDFVHACVPVGVSSAVMRSVRVVMMACFIGVGCKFLAMPQSYWRC